MIFEHQPKKDIKKWKTLTSEMVFSHKWYRLRKDTVELPSGEVIDDYFVSERDNVAVIFALTEDEKVIMVRQYKHGAGDVFLELPAGFFHEGEKPEEAAKRELLEETGYKAGEITCMAITRDNPTKDNNKFYLFFATNCKLFTGQNLDNTEEIEVLLEDPAELRELIAEGEICVHSMISTIYLGLTKMGIL